MVLSDKVEVLVDDEGQSLRFEHFSENSSVFSFFNFLSFDSNKKTTHIAAVQLLIHQNRHRRTCTETAAKEISEGSA